MIRKTNITSSHLPDELVVKAKGEAKELSSKLKNYPHLKVENKNDDLKFCVVRVLKGSLEEAKTSLENEPDIEYVEYNKYRKLCFIPNDPYFIPYQYSPQIMKATSAWNTTQSSPDIKIAIIDSGVDINHPDLTGKAIPGPDYVTGGLTTTDPNGHGTFCAGVAAAITNNRIGIAGMAPKAKILALRVSRDDNLTSVSRLAEALVYAANQGAQVINISLGNYDYSRIDAEAVKFAWEKGSVIIAAAGNEATSLPLYPASYPHVISVGSTTAADLKAAFSNFGESVDVVAPGSNIWSTIPPDSQFVHTPGSLYTVEEGTSFSSPNVAGVAALLAAQGLSNKEIDFTLKTTADKISGTGLLWKHGRVNAYAAVTHARSKGGLL